MIRFITLEGGDGTGKTTQLKALQHHLESQGRRCVVTREPGGTSLGRLIRQALLEAGKEPIAPTAELFLYLADRAQHVQDIILPAIKDGKIVLCDRYTDSTLAYQGYGRGISMEILRRLNAVADQGVQPDLTLLLDCPVELGLARTANRQLEIGADCGREDRFEREKLEFHEKVRAGFLDLARAEPRRFRILDAAQPAAEVAREIRDIVDRELG
jgi:dTMP kinase